MGKVKIYSNQHQAWWATQYCGYTDNVDEAGIYDVDEFRRAYPNITFNDNNEDYMIALDPYTVVYECIDLLSRDGINSKLIAKQKLIEILPDLEEMEKNDNERH